MTDRLRRYISSKGLVVPSDIDDFKPRGSKSYMCVFCDSPHSGQPLVKYAVRGATVGATFTTAFTCWDCAEETLLMENDLKGPKAKGGLFDEMEDTTKARLEAYYRYGKFDSSVDYHYIHSDTPSSKTCYFCKDVALEDYAEIQTPVRSDADNFTGGAIRMCKSCRVECEHSFGKSKHEPLDIMGASQLVRCSMCTDHYLIDTYEVEYRHIAPGTVNLHMCPECYHDQVTNSPPCRLLNSEDRTRRFIQHVCEYCEDKFLVDASIQRSVLYKWHMSADKRFMCDTCAAGTDGPITAIKIKSRVIRLYSVPDGIKVVTTLPTGEIKTVVENVGILDLIFDLYNSTPDYEKKLNF